MNKQILQPNSHLKLGSVRRGTALALPLRTLLLFLLIQLLTFNFQLSTASAQCGITNTAFQSGEYLSYDLYFNWQFVWVKVGTASMSTVKSRYKGQDAYRSSLITRGNSKLDNVFVMRDTLLTYSTLDLAPLYHRKGAEEGDRYYVDELWYTYPNGQCHLRQHELTSSGKHNWKNTDPGKCVYDMMSIYLRARNFDAASLKKGQKITLPIANGHKLQDTWLIYQGKETIQMKNNSTKYRCLVMSFYEREDGESKEIIRFFVTDDANHIPVRLDMFLKFGSAKAYLTGMKGIRSRLTSKVN